MKYRLQEKAQSVGDVSEKGLALFIGDGHFDIKYYVLYDAKKFLKEFNKELESQADLLVDINLSNFQEILLNCILGIIETTKPEGGNAYGASEVEASAAEKGYGPLLYDIAMAHEGGLIPDRESVSPQARNVWKKYFNRSDVKHEPLDDMDKPRTPPKKDDAILFQNSDNDSYDSDGYLASAPGDEIKILNQAYFIKNFPSVNSLTQNHGTVFKTLNELMRDRRIKHLNINSFFFTCAGRYFMRKYHD